MKFLQIVSFYEVYLSGFYRRNSHLVEASFDEQIAALVKDGFGGGLVIEPHIHELGYDTHLIVANCIPPQIQWAREYGIAIKNQKNWMFEIAQKQIEFFKPDILYFLHPMEFDSRFVRTLSWKPSLTIGWRAASIPQGIDWTEFDLILSNSAICRQKALELGARSVESHYPGFPEFIAKAVKDEPKNWDVVFSGQTTGEHRTRIEYLKEVAKASLGNDREFSIGFFTADFKQNPLPVGIAMHNYGSRWGNDMYRTLKSGRIVLNVEIDLGDDQAGNLRLFEITGTGSFTLTQYHADIQNYFEPGVEIETFRNANELTEKICYYLEHADEREAIARRGQERCFRDYSMKSRAEDFDRIIRKHLSKKLNTSGIAHGKSMDGLVSILIPTYNREKYIERAIKSALNQTYRNIEVIISDNCSTDKTLEIVNTYAAQDQRIRCYQHKENIGPIKNWIAGLEKCTGEYVKILWSDDWIEPAFLDETVPFLKESNEVGLVFTSTIVHRSSRDDISYHHPAKQYFSTNEYINMTMQGRGLPYSPGCALIRRKDAKFPLRVGTDNGMNQLIETYGTGPDVIFMLDAARKYSKVAHVPKFLSHFTDHKSSITMQHTDIAMKLYRHVFNEFQKAFGA